MACLHASEGRRNVSASLLSTPLQRGSHVSQSPPQSGPPRSAGSNRVTQLLRESTGGSGAAVLDEIIPLVYEDLRRLAHRKLQAERADHTLSTTALVHESYLRLVDQTRVDWRGRAHFFAVAARVIRRVLVDYARRKSTLRRGGGGVMIPLTEDATGREPRVLELLALDEALSRLADHDARLERIVEYRFFGGMTMEESAEAMGVSLRTAERDWTRAKAYLHRTLRDGPDPGCAGG
jgi:RNA polymerase sigma-70 factor (ECF subfamily)